MIFKGNNLGDEMAKAVAYTLQCTLILQPTYLLSSPDTRKMLSYLHKIFHPNSQGLSQFIKTYS